MLAAVAALGVDMPVAGSLQRFREQPTPPRNCLSCKTILHDSMGCLNVFEPFGHGFGVVLVLIALHQLDRGRRWAIPRVALCALAGGGAADLVKMIIVRIRPHEFPFVGSVWKISVWETFGQWWPGFTILSKEQSFPSAHTAMATGLAAAMIWLYPQGRALFAALAALVGCQRIAAGAHYPSDVLTGAAVGCLAAMLLLSVGRLPGLFARLEKTWRREPAGE